MRKLWMLGALIWAAAPVCHAQTAQEYTAAFDKLLNESRHIVMHVESYCPQGLRCLEGKDKENPMRKIYAYELAEYKPEGVHKAVKTLEEGILAYPNRLDMRLEAVQACRLIEDWACSLRLMEQMLAYSHKNANAWLWKKDKPMPQGKEYMLDVVQGWQQDFFKKEQDEELKKSTQIVLAHYPDHVPSLSALATLYALQGDYAAAEPYFKRAERLAPTDFIVLNNMAEMYRKKGDKKLALQYEKRARKAHKG